MEVIKEVENEPVKEVEIVKLDAQHRASVAEDYVQNLYESVAFQAPKQEGEEIINYETQAHEEELEVKEIKMN